MSAADLLRVVTGFHPAPIGPGDRIDASPILSNLLTKPGQLIDDAGCPGQTRSSKYSHAAVEDWLMIAPAPRFGHLPVHGACRPAPVLAIS